MSSGALLRVLPLCRLLGGHSYSSSAAAVAWAGGDLWVATSWGLAATTAWGLSRLSQGHWKKFWGTWVWTQGYNHMFGDDGGSYSNLGVSLRPQGSDLPKSCGNQTKLLVQRVLSLF